LDALLLFHAGYYCEDPKEPTNFIEMLIKQAHNEPTRTALLGLQHLELTWKTDPLSIPELQNNPSMAMIVGGPRVILQDVSTSLNEGVKNQSILFIYFENCTFSSKHLFYFILLCSEMSFGDF
jgi:hypothetical protein